MKISLIIKQDIINILNELGIDERVRAEQLKIEEFVEIEKFYH